MLESTRLVALEPGGIVSLPAPCRAGGAPLFDALSVRASTRDFSQRDLPIGVVSDLLWAAFGHNRPDGRRTAPSAHNWQEIDIYAATKAGLFRYVPEGHRVECVTTQDLRASTGAQDFVGKAPLELVCVADLDRMQGADRTEQRFYAAFDAGAIVQNVYLFCASEGLATVVRGLVDRPALAARMGLGQRQRVIVAQSVGYPGHASPGP